LLVLLGEEVIKCFKLHRVHNIKQNPLIASVLSPAVITNCEMFVDIFLVHLLFLRGIVSPALGIGSRARCGLELCGYLQKSGTEVKSSNCSSKFLWGWCIKIFERHYVGNPCCVSGKCFMVSTGLRLPVYTRYVLANMP
jgi:hypothetical protein